MREILFRGKRIDNGEWVEGLYVSTRDIVSEEILHIIVRNPADSCGCEIWDFEVVDPESISQFTGLTDKNDKRIFEGDIVFNNMTGRKLIGYLEERAAFCFCDKCITSPAFIGQYNFEYFEVIGNIHDNPELLEDKA